MLENKIVIELLNKYFLYIDNNYKKLISYIKEIKQKNIIKENTLFIPYFLYYINLNLFKRFNFYISDIKDDLNFEHDIYSFNIQLEHQETKKFIDIVICFYIKEITSEITFNVESQSNILKDFLTRLISNFLNEDFSRLLIKQDEMD